MGSLTQAQEISQSSNQEQESFNNQQQDNTKAGLISSQKRDNNFGKKWKRLIIYLNDGSHAQLLSKLKYDNFSQKYFFKKIMEAYLEDEESIRNFIDKIHSENKKNKKRRAKEKKEREEIINDFGLNEDDIENIFDAIEKENDDI